MYVKICRTIFSSKLPLLKVSERNEQIRNSIKTAKLTLSLRLGSKGNLFIPNNVTKLTFQSFRMLATLKFVLFNVVLSTTDVATDMLTFFDLLEDNPLWACLTMVWMMMPFLVHTIFFLFKAATGRCKMCTSFTEVMHQFYKEAGIYLPFVSSVHNIWRAKRLFDLKFGTDKFNFKDHKEAEKILDEAGRCSQAESNFEAGPQSVTQVALKRV